MGRPGGVGITKLHAKREKIRYVADGSLIVPSPATLVDFFIASDFLSWWR